MIFKIGHYGAGAGVAEVVIGLFIGFCIGAVCSWFFITRAKIYSFEELRGAVAKWLRGGRNPVQNQEKELEEVLVRQSEVSSDISAFCPLINARGSICKVHEK